MSPHPSPSDRSARTVLVGLLVAVCVITGLHLVPRTPAAADDAAHAVAAVTDTVRVDELPSPQTRITRGPGRTTRINRARFFFAADAPVRTYECNLDARQWITCPADVTYLNLAQGPRFLQVRAVGRLGRRDATPATRRWTIDGRGPAIRVLGRTTTRDRTPTIRASVTDRFSSVRRGSLGLSLDGRRVTGLRYAAGTGRLTATAPRLAPGRHTARLVAVDSLDNRSVRTWTWRVTR